MMVLSTIADVVPQTFMAHLETIKNAIKKGSVITVDKGVLTLARLAAIYQENNDIIFLFLLNHLEKCRLQSVPQYSESTLIAVTAHNKDEFLNVLRKREEYLTPPEFKRITTIYKTLDAIKNNTR